MIGSPKKHPRGFTFPLSPMLRLWQYRRENALHVLDMALVMHARAQTHHQDAMTEAKCAVEYARALVAHRIEPDLYRHALARIASLEHATALAWQALTAAAMDVADRREKISSIEKMRLALETIEATSLEEWEREAQRHNDQQLGDLWLSARSNAHSQKNLSFNRLLVKKEKISCV